MNLTVAGTGYVGLVTGTGFANLGNKVICFDIDEEKIETLSKGELTIYEPGLEEIFKRNIKTGRLIFTSDPQKAIRESKIILICVGTPCNHIQEADLTSVENIAKQIGKLMNGYKVVVNKSTVPVGTA
ncbi:MAG: UDP-glucose 6-dehydrogenase, partial [Proteobacteria bacterium]|nr:UDP-glucose 6-dehydrogenase [Pseudomonadota bacterium]